MPPGIQVDVPAQGIASGFSEERRGTSPHRRWVKADSHPTVPSLIAKGTPCFKESLLVLSPAGREQTVTLLQHTAAGDLGHPNAADSYPRLAVPACPAPTLPVLFGVTRHMLLAQRPDLLVPKAMDTAPPFPQWVFCPWWNSARYIASPSRV